MRMKIFSIPNDIIHHVAPSDDLTIVDNFFMFFRMHGGFPFDAFQDAFGFPSVFYRNYSDDYTFLESVGFLC